MGRRIGSQWVVGLNDTERKALRLAVQLVEGQAVAVCVGGERPEFARGVAWTLMEMNRMTQHE